MAFTEEEQDRTKLFLSPFLPTLKSPPGRPLLPHPFCLSLALLLSFVSYLPRAFSHQTLSLQLPTSDIRMPQVPSTRWCPTPEQLMILEEMYRSGVRTPNHSQIQQITAHLSYYGKIEGKNVFYWFQNHKARDRQKLRRRLSRHQQLLQQHQMMSHHNPQLHQMDPFRSPLQPHQIPHQLPPPFIQQVLSLSNLE